MIYMQKKLGILRPYGEDDRMKLAGYYDNEKLEVKIKTMSARKQRSLTQLNYYWLLCGKVAENMTDPNWNDKKKVDKQCRVHCGLIDHDRTIVRPDGEVIVDYLSIAMDNMNHIEACNYFDCAIPYMAEVLGCTEEELKGAVYDS